MTKRASDLLPGDLIETHEGFHVITRLEPHDGFIRVHVLSLDPEQQNVRGKKNSYLLPRQFVLRNEQQEQTVKPKRFLFFYRDGERLV